MATVIADGPCPVCERPVTLVHQKRFFRGLYRRTRTCKHEGCDTRFRTSAVEEFGPEKFVRYVKRQAKKARYKKGLLEMLPFADLPPAHQQMMKRILLGAGYVEK